MLRDRLRAGVEVLWPASRPFLLWSVLLGAITPLGVLAAIIGFVGNRAPGLEAVDGRGELFLTGAFVLVTSLEKLFRARRMKHVQAVEFYVVIELILVLIGLGVWAGVTAEQVLHHATSSATASGGIIYFAIATIVAATFIAKLETAGNIESLADVVETEGH